MTHSINEVPITDMLIVCPFRFNTESACPLIDMQNTRAIFRTVTTKIQKDQKRPMDSESLVEQSDFMITSKKNTILEFTDFRLQTTATMASLDMVEATWVLRGRSTENAMMKFSPVHVPFNLFNREKGNNAYWGAEIKAGNNDTLLYASLSAPIYDVQEHHVVNFFAVGPAHGHREESSSPSLFQWVVSQAGRQAASRGSAALSDQPFSELELRDLRNDTEDNSHKFFGDDAPGKAQINNPETGGAVFVASGGIIGGMNWRSLSDLVGVIARSPAGEKQDQVLLRSFPPSRLEQTVSGTASPESHNTSEFEGSGQVFEGIMLWNLEEREGDNPVKSIHR